MRWTDSTYSFCERRCAPIITVSFFCSDSLASRMTFCAPMQSVASGFSAKTFLFALIAYSRCSGRQPGGVWRNTTSTPESTTFL